MRMEELDSLTPIVVSVRVRPSPYPSSGSSSSSSSSVTVTDSSTVVINSEKSFTFDHVFDSRTDQTEFYANSVSAFVPLVSDGYNLSFITYGQTHCGKTYTMIGPDLTCAMNEADFGVIPRFVRDLFRQFDNESGEEDFEVKVSYVDVGNDSIFDLLSDHHLNNNARLELKDILDNETMEWRRCEIRGLCEVDCGSISDVLSCLDTGLAILLKRKRRPDMIGCISAASSSSHSIFELKITTKNQMVYKTSTVRFIDLAGSDQLSNNGVVLSNNVNLGLLSLANVISALGDSRRNVSVVPYTDSILTRILSDSFGGNSVTLIMCCVFSGIDTDQTMNTLALASHASNIQNNPIPNIVTASDARRRDSDLSSLISYPQVAPFSRSTTTSTTTSPLAHRSPFGVQMYYDNPLLPPTFPPPLPPPPPPAPIRPPQSFYPFIPPTQLPQQPRFINQNDINAFIHHFQRLYTVPPPPPPPPILQTETESPLIMPTMRDDVIDLEPIIANSDNHNNNNNNNNTTTNINNNNNEEEAEEDEKTLIAKLERIDEVSEVTSQSSLSSSADFDSEDSDDVIESKMISIQNKFRKETDRLTSELESKIQSSMKDVVDNNDNDVDDESLKRQLSELTASNLESQTEMEMTDLDVQRVQTRLKELKSSIQVKEDLVRDLLITEEETKAMNKKFRFQLRLLQEKSHKVRKDLRMAQRVVREFREDDPPDVQKRVSRYNDELKTLETHIENVERVLVAFETSAASTTAQETTEALTKMKEQHERLQHRLESELKKKTELEAAIDRDQSRIRDLEDKLRRQSQQLEVSLKLSHDLEQQRDRLQSEAERLQSQILETSSYLNNNNEIIAKSSKFGGNRSSYSEIEIRREVAELRSLKDDLIEERSQLEIKYQTEKRKARNLSKRDEYRLVELDVILEAMDSAIDYKNDVLCGKNIIYTLDEDDYEDVLLQKLSRLNLDETKSLLHKFVYRTVDLRTEGNRRQFELEVSEDERKLLYRKLQDLNYHYSSREVAYERKLDIQKAEHLRQLSLLRKQINDHPHSQQEIDDAYEYKLRQLKEELYVTKQDSQRYKRFYKKYYKYFERRDSNSAAAAASSNIRKADIDMPAQVVTREGKKLIVQPKTGGNGTNNVGGATGRSKRK